jgi:hypothetical protein
LLEVACQMPRSPLLHRHRLHRHLQHRRRRRRHRRHRRCVVERGKRPALGNGLRQIPRHLRFLEIMIMLLALVAALTHRRVVLLPVPVPRRHRGEALHRSRRTIRDRRHLGRRLPSRPFRVNFRARFSSEGKSIYILTQL